MSEYVLTVFSKSGEKLLDESFEAEHEPAAKEYGRKRLKTEGYQEYPHRLVTADAKLILFL